MKFFIFISFLFIIACHSRPDNKLIPQPAADTSATMINDKSVSDTLIMSERINGPVSISDTINGKWLFTLTEDIPVVTTQSKNKWVQVGLFIDLTQKQMDDLFIAKESKLFADGKEVGKAIENIHIREAFKSNQGLKGQLVGYTSDSAIRANTIPENIFSSIVNSASPSLLLNNFKQFLRDFQFNEYDGLLPQFKGYEIEENWIEDPSPLLRLWLLFEGDKLYGVFHSRPLPVNGAKTIKVNRGFYFSAFRPDTKTNQALINNFNSFIAQVD